MAPSKTFNMAGLMFSNIIIPNENIRRIWDEKELPYKNPISVVAAQAAYENGEPWLNELKHYLDNNFDYLDRFIEENLPKARFKIPESTYLAWIDVSAYLPHVKSLPLLFAQEGGLLLEGGDMFVANADGYIRLNMACPRSILIEGINRVMKVINAYKK
jgi:cystathionine beta-lyase